jgi:hypothetical protein
MRQYIVQRFEEEKGKMLKLSTTTVSRLFEPPKKSFRSAAYYTGIFDIKQIGGKRF